MSQPATLCRNKVQAKIKEEIELCHDKEFFCHDIAEEECERVCRDILYSVVTLIKENGRETFVATILTLSQNKRMKIRK